MTTKSLTINPASTDTDLEDVRRLCDGLLSWARERYVNEIWMLNRYYPEDDWEKTLADLPTVHALPRGGIWLARLDGRAAGTVMLKPLGDTGICEMKRLIVDEAARGQGVGRALCKRVIDEAIDRGYTTMRFDTGAFHDEAIGLYRSMGFEFRDAYYDVAPDMLSLLKFLEGDLAEIASWRRS